MPPPQLCQWRSGCPAPPSRPLLTNPTGRVDLHASAAVVSDDKLAIDYEIINNGDRSIVAFNRVPSPNSPNAEPVCIGVALACDVTPVSEDTHSCVHPRQHTASKHILCDR